MSQIEISRSPEEFRVNMSIPIRKETRKDGLIYATVPLLGGIETYGKDESDIETAIEEMLEGFIKMAETHGKGIEAELESLGWMKAHLDMSPQINALQFAPKGDKKKSLINTGTPRVLSLAVA